MHVVLVKKHASYAFLAFGYPPLIEFAAMPPVSCIAAMEMQR